MRDTRVPDPAKLVKKQSLEIDEVRALIPHVHRYSFVDLLRIDWLLLRLYKEHPSGSDTRQIRWIENALESNVIRS